MEDGQITEKNSSKRHTITLAFVVVAMFAFGFALVPLYDFVCEITGYNGRTSETTEQTTEAIDFAVDTQRVLKVEFLANVDASLPWDFSPVEPQIKIHPGEMQTVMFKAKNKSRLDRIGQATPFVVPREANKYFRKTECFCFTKQEFKAGEEREMPVTFIIDPALPKDIDTVTLSYSFFEHPDSVSN